MIGGVDIVASQITPSYYYTSSELRRIQRRHLVVPLLSGLGAVVNDARARRAPALPSGEQHPEIGDHRGYRLPDLSQLCGENQSAVPV